MDVIGAVISIGRFYTINTVILDRWAVLDIRIDSSPIVMRRPKLMSSSTRRMGFPMDVTSTVMAYDVSIGLGRFSGYSPDGFLF